MKITGDWISADTTQAVLGALTDAGFQALLVGGWLIVELTAIGPQTWPVLAWSWSPWSPPTIGCGTHWRP